MNQKTKRDQDVADLTEQKPRVSESFPLQQPTVRDDRTPAPQEYLNVCGNCVGWKRAHGLASMGQCLVNLRYLAQAVFTTDMMTCSLTEEAKEKALQRK